MSVLLYVVGAIAVMVGVGMVAFGIPINEFSFGNTLIGAGITAATGGLIILALGVLAGQLHRLSETLAARAPVRGRPAESMETQAEVMPAPGPAAGRAAPVPSRQRAEPATRGVEAAMRDALDARLAASGAAGPASAASAALRGDEPAPPSYAPALRNPEAPPLAVEDEVSLSPEPPRMARPSLPPGTNGGGPEHGHPFQQVWRGTPQPRDVPPLNFDTMWPAEPGSPMLSARPERAPMPPQREAGAAPPGSEPPPAITPSPGITTSPGRASAAVLKSGVVDGMGYTLYVDGSIEAELPQGTLRFASIEDLRSHLEKNG